MDIQILPMQPCHTAQIAALEQTCFSDPWPEQIIAHELENELSLWLCALDGDTVAGYIGSQTVLGEADMMNVAVSPAYRRQGIGRALYEALGFTQIGLRKNYYQHPKEDARILRKDLL